MKRMQTCAAYRTVLSCGLVALVLSGGSLNAQKIEIPLAPASWEASDSIRFERYLDRDAMYINRGVALARGVEMQDGVIEFDMAATPRSSFLGAVFHAAARDNAEVIFFRYFQTGTTDAIQYGPALNNMGAAWQVYSGPGANASADLVRERWMNVRIVLTGPEAKLYLDGAAEPTLTVPRMAGTGGRRLGVWTGLFGRGAYYSNFSYTPARENTPWPAPEFDAGTIMEWEISPVFDASSLTPGTLPDLSSIEWQRVQAEHPGIVLINRYRPAPMVGIPFDAATRLIYVDSVMGGRVAGTKTVLARTFIDSERAHTQRMHFGYSDAVTIYSNGQPLFFGVNAQGFRGNGIMTHVGDAVYLPLRAGRNEIVFAVTEYTGGWALRATIDP